MFPTCQQITDGIKLWTVTHQLVDSLHLCEYTEKHTNTPFNTGTNTAASGTTATTAAFTAKSATISSYYITTNIHITA